MFLDRTRFVDDRAFFLVLRSLERDASDIVSFQRAITHVIFAYLARLVYLNEIFGY